MTASFGSDMMGPTAGASSPIRSVRAIEIDEKLCIPEMLPIDYSRQL